MSERPEARLEKLRLAMQEAEVPVVLLRWMTEVERQLVAMRGDLNTTSGVAERAARNDILYG